MQREVNAHGHVFGLTAAPHVAGGWRALATSHAAAGDAPEVPRPQPGASGGGSPLGILEGGWCGHGGTADAALNALQRRIVVAIRDAAAEQRALPGEADRRRGA